MPSLEGAQQSSFVKLLLIGDSGTGKTGATASLVEAGYRLRFLDFDNKLAGGILPILLKRKNPELLKKVDYEALRDEYHGTALGPIVNGVPVAYTRGLGLMDKWSDG